MAMNRVLVLSVALAMGSALVACGEANNTITGQAQTSTVPETSASSSVPTPTTQSPTTSTVPEGTSPDPSVPESTSATDVVTDFPPERADLTHGGDAWVVVLAASPDAEDPALHAAVAAAEAAGYETSVTDCDAGAAEILGRPEADFTVSVYLRSETDATTAPAAFRARDVEGAVGVVQTYCMD